MMNGTLKTSHPRRALALAFVLFAVWAAAFIRHSAVTGFDGKTYFCLFDDAMISMRYAWNCAHGLGLAWNAGERVEGTTNFLMTLFMVPFTAMLGKSAAVLAVQISGIGFMLAIAALTHALARAFLPPVVPALQARYCLLCALGALAYYPLAFWSLMGMETGLLTVLFLGALVLALRNESGGWLSSALGLLLGLAFLTRPDAALPIAIIMVWRLGVLGRRGWRAWAIEAAMVAALAGGLTLFRWAYYGSPVPNTYRLKLGGFPLGFRLGQGLSFIAPFLLQAAPALALAACGLIRRFDRHKALLATLAAVLVIYPVWIGGDAIPYWRLVAPAFPLLLVLALAEALTWAGWWAVRRRSATLAFTLSTLALLAILAAADAPFVRGLALVQPASEISSAGLNVNVALALNDLTGPGATVAMGWAGIVPYYTGRRAIDLLGKSDPYIASLPPDLSGACGWLGFKSVPGHNKYDLNYSIVAKRPTYVQVFNWGRQDVRDFARRNYVRVSYKGVEIPLLRGSADVRWDRLPPPR